MTPFVGFVNHGRIFAIMKSITLHYVQAFNSLAYELRENECTARWDVGTGRWTLWAKIRPGVGNALHLVAWQFDPIASARLSDTDPVPLVRTTPGGWSFTEPMRVPESWFVEVRVIGVPRPAPWGQAPDGHDTLRPEEAFGASD